MKKTILSFIFILVISLFSCSKSNDMETNATDLYFFRTSQGYDVPDLSIFGVILKINPVTSNTAPVCIDPLCTHDNDDCPLYNISGAIISGNTLFFTKIFKDSIDIWRIKKCVLYAYDMQNGSIKTLETYTDIVIFLGAKDNYCYYIRTECEETESGLIYKYLFCKADGKSGKIIELPLDKNYETSGGINNRDYPNIYAIENDRIFWCYSDGKVFEIYTTNLDGKNKEILNIDVNTREFDVLNGTYNNGFLYCAAVSQPEQNPLGDRMENYRTALQRELYRVSVADNSITSLCEKVGGYVLSGNRIYYVICEDTPEIVGTFNGREEWNWFGSKVYSMAFDGSDKKIECDLAGYNIDAMSGKSPFVGVVTVGETDYFALSFRDYLEDAYSSKYDRSPDIIIINTATGEYSISKYEK